MNLNRYVKRFDTLIIVNYRCTRVLLYAKNAEKY